MTLPLPLELANATVRISQQLPSGLYGQAAGFLVSALGPDGAPRVVLVTANHVLANKMPGDEVQLGLREQQPNGDWRYAPETLRVRSGGTELWTHPPDRDIAVIAVQVPPEAARAAIPLAWLADSDSMTRYGVSPGDPIMALGYPEGLSATSQGFPILRAGVVASYPLSPAFNPTFLIDASVFSGNSGGPVFMAQEGRRQGSGPPQDLQLVMGVLTGQVEAQGAHLNLGVVVQAVFVRQAIAQMDAAAPRTAPPLSAPPLAPATPPVAASAASPQPPPAP